MPGLDDIKIQLEGIGHLLIDNKLVVPRHQRSYAWKEEHVKALFEDYSEAIRKKNNEYFLGTIVSTKQEGSPEVLDGQQRLATTSILLAAIRDYHLTELDDPEGADIIEREFLVRADLKTRDMDPRLRLSRYDHDFFEKRILSRPNSADREIEPNRDSHKRLQMAAAIAHNHVRDILKAESSTNARQEILLEWVNYIRDRAQIIWVRVPSYSNAFTIFETLNDRGLDLSISDLVKNYLFGKAGDDRIDETEASWNTMRGILETVSSNDISKNFIQQYWASKHGVTRTLFNDLKSTITKPREAVGFANELSSAARIYAALRNPEHEFWNPYGVSTRTQVRVLLTLRVWQHRTLLMAILEKFPVREAQKVFKLVVSWTVRFLVSGWSPGRVESLYAKSSIAVRNGKLSDATQLAEFMTGDVPDDEAFAFAFSRATVNQDFLARFYLRALEDCLAGDPYHVVNDDETVISLEHVLPKTPGDGWGHFTTEDHRDYVRRIGNMALLTSDENSRIGNQPFEQKRALFANCTAPLTQQLAQYIQSPWTKEDIEDRQAYLAELAVRAWPLTI